MNTNKFINGLIVELINSINNNYEDNYDYYRFGIESQALKKPGSLKKVFVSFLNKYGFYNNFNNHLFSRSVENIDYPITDFFYLYNNLQDDYSRDLLIKIVAYRMLGHKKVKLPLSNPAFWSNQKLIEANQNKNDFIDIGFKGITMPLTDLNFLGIPLKMYYSALGINIDFIIKQYEFHRGNINIEAEAGDVIIDAGGCYGDTALYFANKTGKSGAVHVFEFIQENIEIFHRNLLLNPDLHYNIKLARFPLWSESGKNVFYLSNGPGSRVSMNEFDGYKNKTETISIDDYRNLYNLKKIDFIKMDIEGAEINALQGAKKVINEFKPKLAIALYHSTADFDIIPRFINDLNLGYKFYLSHSTIYGEETMLFATTKE